MTGMNEGTAVVVTVGFVINAGAPVRLRRSLPHTSEAVCREAVSVPSRRPRLDAAQRAQERPKSTPKRWVSVAVAVARWKNVVVAALAAFLAMVGTFIAFVQRKRRSQNLALERRNLKRQRREQVASLKRQAHQSAEARVRDLQEEILALRSVAVENESQVVECRKKIASSNISHKNLDIRSCLMRLAAHCRQVLQFLREDWLPSAELAEEMLEQAKLERERIEQVLCESSPGELPGRSDSDPSEDVAALIIRREDLVHSLREGRKQCLDLEIKLDVARSELREATDELENFDEDFSSGRRERSVLLRLDQLRDGLLRELHEEFLRLSGTRALALRSGDEILLWTSLLDRINHAADRPVARSLQRSI